MMRKTFAALLLVAGAVGSASHLLAQGQPGLRPGPIRV